MRGKAKISKSLISTKFFQRYLNLREKLDIIEKELKQSYDERRMKKERAAISRMKHDPRAFYKYAKRFSKTNSDVGPFFHIDGNPVNEPSVIVDMLRKQYEGVYSTPDENFKIEDPSAFFSVDDREQQLAIINCDRDEIIQQIDSL